jgi:hypothetical protein
VLNVDGQEGVEHVAAAVEIRLLSKRGRWHQPK